MYDDFWALLAKKAQNFQFSLTFFQVATFLTQAFYTISHNSNLSRTRLKEEEAVERVACIAHRLLSGWEFRDEKLPSAGDSGVPAKVSGVNFLISVAVGQKSKHSQSREWKTRVLEEVSQCLLTDSGSN